MSRDQGQTVTKQVNLIRKQTQFSDHARKTQSLIKVNMKAPMSIAKKETPKFTSKLKASRIKIRLKK
jgi:hypothetical protein